MLSNSTAEAAKFMLHAARNLVKLKADMREQDATVLASMNPANAEIMASMKLAMLQALFKSTGHPVVR